MANKLGIIERAKAAEANSDTTERTAIIKALASKKMRFASAKTVRKVKRTLGVFD